MSIINTIEKCTKILTGIAMNDPTNIIIPKINMQSTTVDIVLPMTSLSIIIPIL